jgi:dephospho-CoA kinase
MVVVGLTGGIGSGKSTVARLLVERGAVLVDADLVARAVVEPGRPALGAIVQRFGPGVLGPDGRLDRPALAAVAFGDAAARRDLNAIVHPVVHSEMLAGVAAAAAADPAAVVILDVPLLAEVGRDAYPLDGVIVVDTPVATAVARLVADRGLSEADARARVAAQVSREERRAIADVVIDNSGDLDDLEAAVARAWAWIEGLAGAPQP